MKKADVIKILEKNALLYKDTLMNKDILVLTKNKNKIYSFILKFNDNNFLHLTGLNTLLSPKDFFYFCINKKLKESDFEFKYNNNMTKNKLNLLPFAINIHKYSKEIGDFNNNGINLKTDKVMGNVTITLGFKYEKNNLFLRPNTLLSGNIKDYSVFPTSPIIATLIKNRSEYKFNEFTYKSKNINIDKLHFPKEITELLTEKAMLELKPSIKNIELKKDLPDAEKEAPSEQQPTAPAKKSIYTMAMENQKANKQPTYNKNKNDISL